MENIKPLGNRLFIEPTEEEKTTKSGIVIPDTADKERPMQGKVVAVGPGKMDDNGNRIAMSVAVGNVVLFKKYGPDEIEINGKTYLVADEDDILAIINEATKDIGAKEAMDILGSNAVKKAIDNSNE